MRTYVLDRAAKTSLYEQLYRGLRADIESGALAAGARLPSKRALAAHLGVSVVTVEGAYDQLVAEGYVAARPRSGFFVQEMAASVAQNAVFGAIGAAKGVHTDDFGMKKSAEGVFSTVLATSYAPKTHVCAKNGESCCTRPPKEAWRAEPRGATPSASARARSPKETRHAGQTEAGPLPWGQTSGEEGGTAASPPECFADFTGARAPEGLFPYQAWARTLRRVLADESERTVLAAGAPQGSPRLRRAIAEHLRGFRGMEVHPDQIVIGSGAQSLYGLLVQLLGRDRVYGIEDPGYPRLARIYRSNDVALAAVPLDDGGPDVAALAREGVQVFHCTPSHQFPLGLTTPIARRRALIEWARAGRYLIEDDFDCEFRMAGRPVPPMQALDCDGRVIYANTFTKTLGAAFRIGYVVLPWPLVRRFREQLGFYACTVGALEQLTLAQFMEAGDYERHVNRQRTHFRRVQNALVQAFAQSGESSLLRLRHVGAGLHFLVEVLVGVGNDADAFERAVAARARAEGVALAPLSGYRFREGTAEGAFGETPAFVMSFSSVSEEAAPRAVEVIVDAMRAELGAFASRDGGAPLLGGCRTDAR